MRKKFYSGVEGHTGFDDGADGKMNPTGDNRLPSRFRVRPVV